MSSTAVTGEATSGPQEVEFPVQGMTCAAWAARLEKKPNTIDGVAASVNFATERAIVTAPGRVPVQQLIDAVAQADYRAEVHDPGIGAACPRRARWCRRASPRPAAGGARGVPVGSGTPLADLLGDLGMTAPQALASQSRLREQDGCTVVLAGWDGQVRGMFAVAGTIKPSAAAAVAHLRRLGLRIVLLTGDSQATAQTVAVLTATDEVIAGVLPDHKVGVIRELQAQGRRVAMVGDGVKRCRARWPCPQRL